ncbi:MAG TPA: histidine kinase [Anaerolineae bacterium]|nr:histidine kinase [Anaerolineae bacterium]
MNGAVTARVVAPRRTYRGGYLIGFLLLAVAALLAAAEYQGRPQMARVMGLMAAYGLLYAAEPLLAPHFRPLPIVYFPAQAALVLAITNTQPFLDNLSSLYIGLWVQALHAFPRRVAIGCMALLALLMTRTLILARSWAEGIGLSLVFLAGAIFCVSYDLLYARTHADQAESQALLAELVEAHEELQEHAARAEELAMARERSRLAREIHDSVSQMILSIRLTAGAARLLLDRDPARVPELLDRLQQMTGSALAELRSIIAELHPPHHP